MFSRLPKKKSGLICFLVKKKKKKKNLPASSVFSKKCLRNNCIFFFGLIRNFDKRRSLTKFRISSHRLKIERGRFSKPPVPVDNRVCDYCPSKIEDEFHFLIQCPKYDKVRNTLFSVGQKHCVNFTSLDDRNKFIWLLTTTDTYIQYGI